MDEKTKKELAKKNLENFYDRINRLHNEEPNKQELVASYVTLADGSVVEDYYWTDHEITPTAIVRWLAKHYNTYSTNKNRWAIRVVLKAELYKKVQEMVEGEEIILGDVLITRE